MEPKSIKVTRVQCHSRTYIQTYNFGVSRMYQWYTTDIFCVDIIYKWKPWQDFWILHFKFQHNCILFTFSQRAGGWRLRAQSFERAHPSTKAAKYFRFLSILSPKYSNQISGKIFLYAKYFSISKDISLQYCSEILAIKYQAKYLQNTFNQISGKILLYGIAAKYFPSNVRRKNVYSIAAKYF